LTIENQDIKISTISFSPVNKNEEEDTNEIRQGTIKTTNLDDRILVLFKEYIKYLFNQNKRTYSSDITPCDETSLDLKQKLSECLKYNLNQEKDIQKFEIFSKKLAENLIHQMNNTTNPTSGILFTMIANVKEKNYIFILKVDLAKEVIQIWVDEENLNLNIDEIKNAMPSPDKLQKGAVYPHPEISKDYKIVQETFHSGYFDQFLQCKREPPEYKQFKIINDVLDIVKEELGSEDEEVQTDLIVNQYFESIEEEDGIFSKDDLIECGKKTVPQANDNQIEKVINRELESKNMPDIYIPKEATITNKIEITIDDIKIKGPYQSITDKVKIEVEEGRYSVTVKGSTYKKRIHK
jgi:hypothetical protein